MQAGQLDRIATIQRKRVTRDQDFGSESIAWSTFAECRAKVRDLNAIERDGSGLRTITRTTMVTIRWVDGLSSDMRIKLDDGRLLNIVSLAEIGRKDGYQIVCEEYSA